MRLAPHRLLTITEFLALRSWRGALGPDHPAPMVYDPPDSQQESETTLQACVAPLHFFLRRGDEHHVQTEGVRAVLSQHRIGIDDVALRLGHDVAVLEHHPLCEKTLERLVERDETHVAE